MTEVPQTHTFRIATVADGDVFPNAPAAVEYTMQREEAVSLLRESASLVATGTPLRTSEIPVQGDLRWLQSDDRDVIEDDEDLFRAVDWDSDLGSIRHEFIRLTHVAGAVTIEILGRERHTNAEVLSGEISTERLKQVFQISDDEAQPRVFLVQSESRRLVDNEDVTEPLSVVPCFTQKLAQDQALHDVNEYRGKLGLSAAEDPEEWEQALQEAREHARDDEQALFIAIRETPLKSTPGPAAKAANTQARRRAQLR